MPNTTRSKQVTRQYPGTSVARIFCGAYILWHVLVCIKHLACPATKTTVRNITLCIINFTYYNLYGNIMRGKYYISIFTSLSLFPLTIMCLYYVPIYKIIFYIYIGECVCVCLCVCVSFQALYTSRLWSDRNQIWHTHADSPRKGSG